MSPARLPGMPPLLLLVLISLCGTLAIHIYVPALPLVGRDLGTNMVVMQSTVSLYIVGLAAGQLIYGPLADGFGRRPVLLVGLSLFLVASVAAAFASDATSLIAARLLQALGGCAGLVLGRVIVRDTSSTQDTVRRLALLNLMTTLAPAFAPMVGAMLASALGWRSIFSVLACLGVMTLGLCWRKLPETCKPSGEVRVSQLVVDYGQLLGSGRFLALAVGGSFATMGMYGLMVSAPFILTGELGRSTTEVGFIMMLMMLGLTVGSAITSRLVGRVNLDTLLLRGNFMSLAAAVVFLVLVLTDQLTVWSTVVLFAAMTLAVGFSGPGAVTKVLSVHPRITGTASGFYGAGQMLVGALSTVGVGFGPRPALATAVVMVVAGLISQSCLRWAVWREKRALAT